MKKVAIALLLMVLLWMLVVGVINSHKSRGASSNESVKAVAILPLTGPAAQYGRYTQQGMLLALKELEAEAAGKPISLSVIFEDSKSEPKEAVTIVKKFTSINHVEVVFVLTTAETTAIAPVCEQTHTVMITATVAPGAADLGEYVFRNAGNLAKDAEAMADMCINSLGLKRVAVLALNMPALREIEAVFRKRLEMSGGQPIAAEWGNKGDTDFRAQLSKLREQSPDAIYLLGYVEVAYIMKQARELGFKVQFLGDPSMESPKVIEIAGAAADGAIFTRAAFDANASEASISAFNSAYKNAYGEAPEVFAAQAYDNIHLLNMVLQRGGRNADDIRNGLLAIRDFPGISGRTTFLKNGDVNKPASFRTIRDGSFTDFLP